MEAARLPQPAGLVTGRPLLGSLLLRDQLVSAEQLEWAMTEKERTGERLGEVLLRLGWVDENPLARLIAEQHGLEFLDLDRQQPNPAAAGLLPERHAYRYRAVPVRFMGDMLLVAVEDPTDLLGRDELKLALGVPLQLVVSTASSVTAALERIHGRQEQIAPKTTTLASEVRAEAQGTPAIDFVNRIINRAIQEHASDIHIEPQRDRVVVRARIDGVLRRIEEIPIDFAQAVVARLKIMSDLDIAERRAPQDGRVSITFGGEPMDLRIAVVPTTWGEQVVLRVLYRTTHARDLSQLGMASDTEDAFRRALAQPFGLVISSGPTGSGKTTTLYAGLEMLNSEDRAIMTIEDPVEYQIEGLCQIDVNVKAGLTFATGLRSILRSDPDILLLGEIRDMETAEIAVQAALTGHLVLTTLHANSSVRSVARLVEMGVEPEMIANTVNCIIAQRLARRLCIECREPYYASPNLFACDLEAGQSMAVPAAQLYRPAGCAACGGTGYRGRVAFYELLDMGSPSLRRLVSKPNDELEEAALAAGLRTLSQDGMRLCLEGLTSVDEIQRIVGSVA